MSFERPGARSTLPLLFVVSCSIFFSACRPEKEHPGCPGESFRSARSDVDCVCDDDEVLKAGNLECEACDPFPSGGAYCECRDVPAVLSFDSRLDMALGVTSKQVTCGPPTECPVGQRKDEASDACVACAALECGASCGDCPVGQSCVSGQCFPVAVCVIQPDDALSFDCKHGPGDIVEYIPESGFPEGARCDFTQDMCDYTGIIEPLVPFDTTGCPGESSFEDGVCACPSGKVLGAGALECKDCEPEASGEAYCDCGENAVFSFDGRIDWSLRLASEQVACREPSQCPDGQRRAPDSDECIACGALDCGTGCGLCDVGSTCISGTCVAAAACRVEEVLQSAAGLPCSYEVGELAGFGLLSTVPSGAACTVTPGDSCTYYGTSEVLSK